MINHWSARLDKQCQWKSCRAEFVPARLQTRLVLRCLGWPSMTGALDSEEKAVRTALKPVGDKAKRAGSPATSEAGMQHSSCVWRDGSLCGWKARGCVGCSRRRRPGRHPTDIAGVRGRRHTHPDSLDPAACGRASQRRPANCALPPVCGRPRAFSRFCSSPCGHVARTCHNHVLLLSNQIITHLIVHHRSM